MKYFIPALVMLLATFSNATATQAKGLFTAEEKPEMWCLALNIYYESRSSNRADRMAVADVVMNRVKHTYYPNTICGVVQQGKQYASGAMKGATHYHATYVEPEWARDFALVGRIGEHIFYRWE